MNNREKSKLDIVSADSVVIETSPVIEVEPETLDISSDSSLTVLIKHDYYSEDSAHGRDLIRAFITALSYRKADIARILVTGSGVKLLTGNNTLYKEFKELLSDVAVLTVCHESLDVYGVSISDLPSNCENLDSTAFATAVINLQNPVILE